ncbi:hypothetical protein ACFORL_06785, partial [Legionella dresdenensis]
WAGAVYTTGAVTSDCSVTFSSLEPVVTPSGDANLTINPNTPQSVTPGATQQFTVTPNPGYNVNPTVGGTCPAGSWAGSVYTTGAINGDCTVVFSSLQMPTVTPSGDANLTINPNTPQTINYGATQQFTVTPDPGYTVNPTVGGTCPAGSWAGAVYTTGAVTSDCSVTFSSLEPVVTPSGDANLTINPNTPQS